MGRFAHPETDGDDIQETWDLGGRACGIQVCAGVEHQFVFSSREFGGGQDVAVGAAVVIGDQAADMGARVARHPIQINL